MSERPLHRGVIRKQGAFMRDLKYGHYGKRLAPNSPQARRMSLQVTA
jgi:hypothetical protein